MTLTFVELISIVISAIVGGMYWGPWLALSRSLSTFEPVVFLAIVNRLNRNMAPLMTWLTPLGLLSTLPTLYLSFGNQPVTFYFTLAGFVCFVIALIVTMTIEVPIVMQIITWNVSAMPPNWQQLRDRWVNFHILRIIGGIVGLALLVAGAIF